MGLLLPAVHNVNSDELYGVQYVQDGHADGEGHELEDLCAGDGGLDHGDITGNLVADVVRRFI